LVADGPVFAIAVTGGGFEFVIAIAVTFPRPTESFPSDLPSADPHERLVGRKGVGIFEVIHEELVTVLVAGIAQALYRLGAQQLRLISEAAKLQLVGPDVFGEIASRHAGRPGFEH